MAIAGIDACLQALPQRITESRSFGNEYGWKSSMRGMRVTAALEVSLRGRWKGVSLRMSSKVGACSTSRRCMTLICAATAVEKIQQEQGAPTTNPCGVVNQFWTWRGQKIRYQALNETGTGPSVVLVHGLFVNADHWRRNMQPLADAGYRVYAIDLLGCGYSSKPAPYGDEGKLISGEKGRTLGSPESDLGTAGGKLRRARVDLAHPLGSCYNFYTWSEQVCDFTKEVVGGPPGSTSIVSNSIGTITALQAAVDCPALFNAVMTINPNFRELHTAEIPGLAVPAVRAVQAALRKYGKGLFDAAANPKTVKQILLEPYYDKTAVTDELVDVLLTPLLAEGVPEILFDQLSYSAGPLPEQLLQDPRLSVPVWVCWGEKDPWTPAKRVLALDRFDSVKKVVTVPAVGHCPHDEAPQLVNPIILDFLNSIASVKAA